MNNEIYIKICSIQLKNDAWYLYDCNDEELPQPSRKRIFSSAMKRHYLNKRKGRKDGISTVWVLVGVTDENKEICEQIGRTKDLINSLNEIRENVKDFYYNDDGKYGVLRRNYEKIVFYEVDIDKYLENDKLFIKTYGEAPEDTFLSLAYYFIRAAYVEGKLGYETSASMYRKSSLDEYFYLYYEEKNLMKQKNKRY